MARSPSSTGAPSYLKLANLPRHFHPKHLIGSKTTRNRRFTPARFFQTLVSLISGSNSEGYLQALIGTFGEKKIDSLPTKGALTQMRKRISYRFFQEQLDRLLKRFHNHRRTWRGLCVYATDGWELEIPRSKELWKAGYRGRAVSSQRDTYYLRMYLTHCYDVLSRVTHSLTHHSHNDEISDAQTLVAGLGKKALVLYDRLFISQRMIGTHKRAGNFFVMRARKSSLKAVQKFFKSPKKRSRFVYDGVTLHLIKIKNPRKENEFAVFLTNLPASWVDADTIQKLYALRWEVENSFRDLAQTLRIEQWHSKTLNGILQELYCSLWLMNFTQMQIFYSEPKPEKLLELEYRKPNFKLIYGWVRDRLGQVFQRFRRLTSDIQILIKISTQKRKRLSRQYPRELKYAAPPYPYNNTCWTWEGLN